jgi:hypothetical protein
MSGWCLAAKAADAKLKSRSAPSEFQMPSFECRTKRGSKCLKFGAWNSEFEIWTTFRTLFSNDFPSCPKEGVDTDFAGRENVSPARLIRKAEIIRGTLPARMAVLCLQHNNKLTVERNQHRMKTQFLLRGFTSARTRKSRAIGAALATFAATAIVAQAQPVQIVQQFQLPPLSYVDLGYTQEQVSVPTVRTRRCPGWLSGAR